MQDEKFDYSSCLLQERIMKWLEIIEVRTIESNYNFVKSVIVSIINKINNENNNQNIKLYINSNYKSDISIHISTKTNKKINNGSEIGLSISANIKEFGLVNHYVLQEIVPDKNKR
jgi:hypothetical protein